jgi:Flp pilus assembly protein TadG
MAAIVRFARRARAERGAELIEMAIVTPILLMIIAGIFDFGMMFRAWEIVTNAAREGARIGSLPGYTAQDIDARVEEYMAVSGITNTCDLDEPAAGDPCGAPGATLCNVCVQTGTVDLSAGTLSTRIVTVSSRQPLPSLSVIGTFFGGNFTSVNVASSSQMRTEVALTPP